MNYEGVIILSMGETPWGNFCGRSSSLVFMLFAYFYLHHVLDKIPTWKLFTLITLNGKMKNRKKSLGKEKKRKKKTAQRRKKYLHFSKERSNLNFWPLIKLKFVIHKVKTRFLYTRFIIHLIALIQKHKQSPGSVIFK